MLVALSTSGTSPNVVAAVRVARELDITTWAMTGPVPNPLASLADDTSSVDATATATVQELHLVALHLVCAAFDCALDWSDAGFRTRQWWWRTRNRSNAGIGARNLCAAVVAAARDRLVLGAEAHTGQRPGPA